jgi:uncharacterized protein (DUF1800 family)
MSMKSNRAAAAHLHRRAAFGLTGPQLDQAASSYDALVDRLVSGTAQNDGAPSAVVDQSLDEGQRIAALRWWWVDQMASNESPLVEKMTLFWHGHFCSGNLKVVNARLMHRQNQTLRANALGNFRALAQAIAVDPAMLRYLDNEANVAQQPQENFARELWELFLLGRGHYTQDEVVSSARAWTGHGLNTSPDPLLDRTEYVFRPEWHDPEPKTIFGRSALFDGPDVINWTLDGPRGQDVARFIVTKLWRWFASADTTQAPIDELAAGFVKSEWDIKQVVRALLAHPKFNDPSIHFSMVRSPVEFQVASLRATGLGSQDVGPDWPIVAMGQGLFDPPNVAGWQGHAAWISSAASLAKVQWCDAIGWVASGRQRFGDLGALAPADAVDHMLTALSLDEVAPQRRDSLLQWLTTERAADPDSANQRLCAVAMLLPEFSVS